MKWIDIKTRMPAMEEHVLVYGNLFTGYDGPSIVIAHWTLSDYGAGDIVVWEEFFRCEQIGYQENVTHWMPLPRGPKIKKGASKTSSHSNKQTPE